MSPEATAALEKLKELRALEVSCVRTTKTQHVLLRSLSPEVLLEILNETLGSRKVGHLQPAGSGWGVDGVTTLQRGFPLKFFTSNPTQAFGAGARPNRVRGCNAELSGSAESRLNEWFNTSCFSQPNAFTFGNESRVDSSLRQQGIVNFDFAVFKRTTFGPGERMGIEFRTEFFNLFNHPQFGAPDTGLPSATFGVANSTINNPRLVQFAMKFAF